MIVKKPTNYTSNLSTLSSTDSLLERIHLIPTELIDRPQWVVWRNEADAKIPRQSLCPNRKAKVNDPATWATFTESIETFARLQGSDNQLTGIGYVFAEDDPFVGVDLDDCVEGDTIHPAAQDIITSLDGYTEISPSATGVKIWTRATLPLSTTGKTKRDAPWGGAIEIYHRGRWFAVTGWRVDR